MGVGPLSSHRSGGECHLTEPVEHVPPINGVRAQGEGATGKAFAQLKRFHPVDDAFPFQAFEVNPNALTNSRFKASNKVIGVNLVGQCVIAHGIRELIRLNVQASRDKLHYLVVYRGFG